MLTNADKNHNFVDGKGRWWTLLGVEGGGVKQTALFQPLHGFQLAPSGWRRLVGRWLTWAAPRDLAETQLKPAPEHSCPHCEGTGEVL